MAIATNKFTLTTTAEKVVAASINPQRVTLHNMSKSSNDFIHIGGAETITTTNSIHIDPAETLQLMLLPGEELFALATKDTIPLGVFVQVQGT